MKQGLVRLLYNFGKRFMGWTLHMIMCVLLCYPVSIRVYCQQGVLFLVFTEIELSYVYVIIVSPDESRGYLGFSTVTPPPQRFHFGRDNLKNILVRTFKFGMWVYMGNATNAIVL